uniref:Outer dynein arm docking complex subunit 3 n=1 Tax=Cynoglossus semilaevis TaxID=244447 RepID=A0A3P8W778_CYNSE
MSFGADAIKNPLHDKITEMQRKIQLLEGDRTAYYESSQLTIKKNKESIQQLRQENKKLHRKLANAKAGDEHIIKAAFQNRGSEKHAFRNMSGKVALNTMDQKVLSKVKRLNALKHTSHSYQQRVEELREEYKRREPEESSGALSADAHTQKQEEEAMKLRALENSLEKAQFKCKEADNIFSNYLKLKSHLQDESLTFQGQLDQLEAEILRHREELEGLRVMNNNAQLSKEAAKAELQRQEELLNKERKERERILTTYRRRVEEQKAQAEKVERRTQRSAMQQDELSSEVQRSITRMTGEEKSISTLEETFHHIKEATGVTNIHETVECFIAQKETHQHLEKLRTENQTVLQQLKEQKELLDQQFQDMKYSGEDKLSSNHQVLEEREQQLQAQQQRCDAAKENLDSLTKTLSTVRAGVEHLADKLQHITLSQDGAARVSPESQDLVLELLAQSELKLQSLQKELQGKDLAAVLKEMEEEEFSIRIEGKLPDYNTRVNPPEDPRLDLQDSGDNEFLTFNTHTHTHKGFIHITV